MTISEEDRTEKAIDAMRAKRLDLINAPLDRIYGELFKAGQLAYLNGDVVVPRECYDAISRAMPGGLTVIRHRLV